MRNGRWLVMFAGVAVVVGLFLLLRPESDEPDTASSPTTSPTPSATAESPEPTPTATEPDAVEIEVEEGRVKGPRRIQLSQGDQVRLEVKADVADEVHVHGYDMLFDVAPGQRTLVSFQADITGIFEIELESSGVLLTRLEVTP